jgi:glycosyltransferase involved in cell wall biosynthesis
MFISIKRAIFSIVDPKGLRSIHDLFDADYYKKTYSEVSNVADLLSHYISVGFVEGKNPNPLIHNEWYRATYGSSMDFPDPLSDYAFMGWKKGKNPNPLFDTAFYLDAYSDVRNSGMNPLAHYIKSGAGEGRWPNRYFDSKYYLTTYKDVARAKVNPLSHFLSSGAYEGRNPSAQFSVHFYESLHPELKNRGINHLEHFINSGYKGPVSSRFAKSCPSADDAYLLFDEEFYISLYPEVKDCGLSPFRHYCLIGYKEGRKPNPLFDPSWYLATYCAYIKDPNPLIDFADDGWKNRRNPNPLFDIEFYLGKNGDVASSGINPFLHFLHHGAWEGRWPNSFFDPAYYLRTYRDVAEANLNPLYHFLSSGAQEGRNPSARFDTSFYLNSHPEVAQSGLNPLVHYLQIGAENGLECAPPRESEAAAPQDYIPPVNFLPWFSPLNLALDPALASSPMLNVLVPGLAMKHMSGGPNTALNLAGRLAALGAPVRFCSTDAAIDSDQSNFWTHLRRLAGIGDRSIKAELMDMSNRYVTSFIGKNDLFLATAWWTAQMAKYALRLTDVKVFVYLIQDYEPLLHAASTPYALAQETYDLDHLAVINTSLLFEFLVGQKIGRYADQSFSNRALVFEPAVDKSLFRLHAPRSERKRKLLFYMRPTNGLRNMFELGIAALQKCIYDGLFDSKHWEFIGMGESCPAVDLGQGCRLEAAPWLSLDGYAEQMGGADILLSLMLSPHPSYPPLEMALCGHPVVTNVFANKTAERLSRYSRNIIGVEATIEDIAEGLRTAVNISNHASAQAALESNIPQTWDEALAGLAGALFDRLLALYGAPQPFTPFTAAPGAVNRARSAVGFRKWPSNCYEATKYRRQAERMGAYPQGFPELCSLLTTVWDTKPEFLLELAESVLSQDCGTGFEWIILDNGCKSSETRTTLADIAKHSAVRLIRVDENLGIIGGMRHILPAATRRYVVPLDSDDILTPDCLRIITSVIVKNKYPDILYTDEDKILGESYRDPYDKPDWDPVLFFHSCYIAHLCCFSRETAIKLGVYSDESVSGCHDYDTFSRFYLNKYEPFHVPEVVYSWRMHQQSTAANIKSKDYIMSSQKNVLQAFLNARGPGFLVEPSPLFDGTPDWRFVRSPAESSEMLGEGGEIETIVFGIDCGSKNSGDDYGYVALPSNAIAKDLANAIGGVGERSIFHLLWRGGRIVGADWASEALGLMELFPDTVMVGGTVYRGMIIEAAGGQFGVGRGCESHDVGRHVGDPGYFAQMLKPHTAACVPIEHSVIDGQFLREALELIGDAPLSIHELAPWLGAIAYEKGKRVVFSPFLRVEALVSLRRLDDGMWLAFRNRFSHLMTETRLFSSNLSRNLSEPYHPIAPSERRPDAVHRCPVSYPRRLKAERIARQLGRRSINSGIALGLMTSVYARTNSELLTRLIESIREQTRCVDQWTILENGPISREVANCLSAAERTLPVKRLRVKRNLGIQGAMAYCLARTRCEVVAPLDADDLLEPDTIELVKGVFSETGADLVFTDEDHIIDGMFQAPFRRGPFDGVLNACDSYIWHFVAYRREKAIQLGVYTDKGTEFCHDWDTVTRFALSGAKLEHLPFVLYHWRMHPASTSGSGSMNEGTQLSVERMLTRQINATQNPKLYEVVPFPLDRGIPQLSIRRKTTWPTPTVAIIVGPSGDERVVRRNDAISTFKYISTDDGVKSSLGQRVREILEGLCSDISLLMFMSSELDVPSEAAVFEAMRVFEMHAFVGAVGGRIFDANRKIEDVGLSRFRDIHGAPFDWRGLRRDDHGAFALALKPQIMHLISRRLFFIRRAVVEEALRNGKLNMGVGFLESVIAFTNERDYLCAYSPLIDTQ